MADALTEGHPTPRAAAAGNAESRMERLFHLTLAISVAGHVVVLGAQLLTTGGFSRFGRAAHPLKLIYEYEAAKGNLSWAQQELRRAQARVHEAPDPSSQPFQGAGADGQPLEGWLQGAVASRLSNLIAQIKIGGSDAQGLPSAASSLTGAWSTAIDLTNVTEAAQGNPVLLTYFSAIREHIQRTANTRPWLPQGTSTEGTVYVGFIVDRSGHIQSVSVIAERSVRSPLLRDVALRIIKASDPFLPFPPSFPGETKTIMVPIEFVLGS